MIARHAAVAALGALLSAAMIIAGAAAIAHHPIAATLPALPFLGAPRFVMTPFSGFFTLFAGLVAFPTSIYSAAYLERYPRSSKAWFALGYLLLLLSVVGIFSAADVVSFFVAWEIMTLTSSALVAYEWHDRGRVRAAIGMLVMSEFGTAATILALLLAAHPAGALSFASIARESSAISMPARVFIALLSFFGFGVKAGILPFNSWLPRAYPAAPSNVTAVVAGVLVNCGVYGMLLVNLVLVPENAALFGGLALLFGSLSAIAGILYATIEDDLKRMLAYSSIENLGIVVAALGAGAVFLSMDRLDLAALGFGAGLWHMSNHSLFKSLLFLGTGAIEMRAGTRRMNALGGLARAMPLTAFVFLIGVLAIASVPPLNGFASEWLTLETLLRSAEIAPAAIKVGFVLVGALLALTAALALTCFVKAYAMTFLGVARSDAARDAKADVSRAACAGMTLLAVLCLLAGIFPAYVVQLVDAALPGVLHGHLSQVLLPPFLAANGGGLPQAFVHDFTAIGAAIGTGLIPGRGLVLLHRGAAANPVVFAMSSTYIAAFAGIIVAAIFLAILVVRHRRKSAAAIWVGGLNPHLPEMSYTATGFSNPVRVIFEAVFDPRTVEHTREAVHDHFRVAVTRQREDAFIADRLVTEPLVAKARSYAVSLARMHHGRLEGYVLYALGALVAVLLVSLFL